MNWRHLHYEIDIIARHQNILVFVEIKTRSTFKYGFPDESIDHKKEKATWVIDNSGSIEATTKQVDTWWNAIQKNEK